MSMTVADCFALCVLVALFVGAAAFWIARASLASFGRTTPKPHLNEPRLNEPKPPSANATLLADERKSDLSGLRCCPCGPRLWRLSEPHFDDQPRCNDAECSERSYDYAKDKLTSFAPSRLHRCVLKARILLRKPVLSLDTLFTRQVSHVADPKFVPDLGSTEALKASAILVRYCHLSRFPPAGLACAVAGRGRFVPLGHSRRQQPRASHDEDDANKACDRAAEGSDLL